MGSAQSVPPNGKSLVYKFIFLDRSPSHGPFIAVLGRGVSALHRSLGSSGTFAAKSPVMTNEMNQPMSPAHQIINVEGGVPIRAWTVGVPFEAEARAQLERIARMPFIHRHVAVMPDVHLGKGAAVGSVIATKRAIIPAAVGVDI